ncbi:MAG: hypothetical protein MUF81_12995 [Verrucomicrobia bacterium]|jgi:hypothetical protein|nr:hypothetical protein [Verrucomicrobiota bacterium]
MKTSVGLWDALFGVRITIEHPSPNGGVKKVQVTKKWFDQMQRERKIKPVSGPMVPVNILDSSGGLDPKQFDDPTDYLDALAKRGDYFVEFWTVGVEVSEEQYRKFLDPDTQELYALKRHQDGAPNTYLVRRDLWEDVRKV